MALWHCQFKPSLNDDMLKITVDKNGRFLVANLNINQDDLCEVNMYAPNDQNKQVNFFDKIIDPIRRSSTNNTLLVGDFNCPLTEVDKVGVRDKLHIKRTIQAIQELCNSFDLVDVWRTQELEEIKIQCEREIAITNGNLNKF